MTGYEYIAHLLKDVDSKTPWGAIIQKVRQRQDQHMMMDLVADLQSEGREHPAVMSEILGAKVYSKLMDL